MSENLENPAIRETREVLKIYKNICFSCSYFTRNSKHDEKSCYEETFCSAKRYKVIIGMDNSTLELEYADAVMKKDKARINSAMEKIAEHEDSAEILQNAALIIMELKKDSNVSI